MGELQFKFCLPRRPRRKFQIAIEALFMIDFPTIKHKFSFFLDRKQRKVTLDIASNTITHSKHFEIPGMNETSTIRSLALLFADNSLTLFVDCKESSKLEIDVGLSKLYLQMEDPVIKLFRERKYPLHFDPSVERAFGRSNCQKNGKRGNKKLLRNKQNEKGNILGPLLKHICGHCSNKNLSKTLRLRDSFMLIFPFTPSFSTSHKRHSCPA